jgi:hypothetical protein
LSACFEALLALAQPCAVRATDARSRSIRPASDQQATMINEAPLSQFQSLGGGLVRPIYADYSFGNIPNTI